MQTKQENQLEINNSIGTAGYARTVGEDGKSYRTGISALISGAIGDDIEQLENDVEALQTTVGEHTADIQNNSDDISDLQTLTSGHTTSIGNLQTAVGTNTEDITDLKEELENISGISDDVKVALLQIASKVAYIDDDGQDYYDALYDALYPPADLVSISAVYTQSGMVYDTDTLDSLKADLVVTALYDDQTTEPVTSYTLSGTLTAGTSTITVSYGGKTTTFTVTVTAEPVNPFVGVHWNDGVRVLGKDEYTGHSNYTTTDYVDISAINSITVTNTMTGNMQYAINWYSSNVNSSYISNKTGYLNNASATSNKPENAQYARICATKLGGGYPYATGAIEITVG